MNNTEKMEVLEAESFWVIIYVFSQEKLKIRG